MEGVRQRVADLAEQHDLVDRDRRLPAPRPGRRSGDADDVAEIDVDRARPRRVAEELDATAAIDEIEEDELPHFPTSEHTAGRANLLLRLGPRLERLGRLTHLGERDGAGEALRRHA